MDRFHSLRRRTREILVVAEPGDRLSRAFDVFLYGLIFLNVVAIVLESVAAIRTRAEVAFWWFEVCSVAIFTLEYLLRLWSCTTIPRFAAPLRGRLRFALTPMSVVDLLAVLPFYLPFLGVDLRFVRLLRLLRLILLAKLGRYSQVLQTFWRVLVSKREEVAMSLAILLLLLLVASSLMYYVERDAQPEAFASIPHAMWWGVVTLTTVGYGDIYPVTALGRLLGAGIAILGIGMFALPTGILGAAFVEEVQRGRPGPVHCPHCGQEL